MDECKENEKRIIMDAVYKKLITYDYTEEAVGDELANLIIVLNKDVIKN